ncbi:hypothetical protein JTB14_013264 [Gonioctena quinquepunctata]|nr:hypothetical protein JTB14_013264 [Gonioctena quinquepunctata]
MEEGLVEGSMEFVKMHIGFMSSRRRDVDENYTQSVFIMPMTMNDGGVGDAELMYKLFAQLRNELEIALRGSEIEATLCVKHEERKKTPRVKRATQPERDKIIIKAQEGKT